MRKRSQEDKLK